VSNSSGCLPNTFPKTLTNYEILEAGNSVDLVLEILERAALRLAEDSPLHLHEPKGHFDPNTTLASVEIEIVVSLLQSIKTRVDGDNVLGRSIRCICDDAVSEGKISNTACEGYLVDRIIISCRSWGGNSQVGESAMMIGHSLNVHPIALIVARVMVHQRLLKPWQQESWKHRHEHQRLLQPWPQESSKHRHEQATRIVIRVYSRPTVVHADTIIADLLIGAGII
jgi:hypothetical protein